MAKTTWNEGAYTIINYGNGEAYLIVHTASDDDMYVQGDDATEWRAGYDVASNPEEYIRDNWS